MFSPGFARLIVAFLSFILIVVSVILYKNYRKTSLILFIIAIYWLANIFFGKSSLESEGEKLYVGAYRFYPSKSKYREANLDKYKNCILNVYANNTFEISGSMPLVSNKGKWYYKDDGDWGWIEYRFKGMKQSAEILSPSSDEWIFIEGIVADSGSDTLSFAKVKANIQ